MAEEIKRYVPREERANVLTHFLGGVVFLVAGIPLWREFSDRAWSLRVGVAIYFLTILGMFFASASYHFAESERVRLFLRKIDHAAIYFLIAGTYTPIFLGPLKTPYGLTLLTALWVLVAAGTAMKFTLPQKYHKIDLILYVLMGWCALLDVVPVFRAFPPRGVALLFAGGIVYTAGIALYVRRAPFAHAWWHAAVFFGVLLHFLAILSLAQ
ncbi:MAG: hemolysin III family protein [Victivallaceae bacterium]|nr:hemolysin III family protein [Victivallaceae bacterium]